MKRFLLSMKLVCDKRRQKRNIKRFLSFDLNATAKPDTIKLGIAQSPERRAQNPEPNKMRRRTTKLVQ